MTEREGVGALLTSVSVPAVVAAEAGLKLIVNAEEAPGATVSGKEITLAANPEPVTLACVTLRLAVPGFLTVTVCVLVTPPATLPKLMLEGTTEICGCTAVPLSATVLGEFVASLTTVNVPVDVPAVVGEKVILTVAVCPASNVAGRVTPLAVKPVPVAVICVTVTLPVPVFVRVAF